MVRDQPQRSSAERSPPKDRREDLRNFLKRDLSRHARRQEGHHAFWHALGSFGVVGWSIALTAVAGALAGRFLDQRFGTGVHFTLMLITLGAGLGSYAAWQALHEGNSRSQ